MNHKPWFKIWQDRYFSDSRESRLTLEERGLLIVLWCLCGRDHREVISTSTADLSRMTRSRPSRVFRILTRLQSDGWLKIIDQKTLQVCGWEELQAPSESYERVRRHRDKMKRCNVSMKRQEEEVDKDSSPTPSRSRTVAEITAAFLREQDEETRRLAARPELSKEEIRRRSDEIIARAKANGSWKPKPVGGQIASFIQEPKENANA